MVANVDAKLADRDDPPDWRDELKAYLTSGIAPTEPTEAKRLRTQASRYVVIAGQLYKRGFSTPLLKCLNLAEADYVTREVHEGICGLHSGARTTVSKLLRAGYYWPTMNTDCAAFVKRCQPCQRHGNLIHQPAEQLHCIPPAWPFATWGDDILGPFPLAKGQCKFLIVAVDLFTKWIEAEPLACISAHQVQKFLWRNIITRFGSTTQETPFRLVYGSDAMIPVEIGEPSFRRAHYDESNNEAELRENLDSVEEIRDQAQVVAEATKQRYKRRFDSRVKPREFREGDLIWRATGEARKDPRHGKLAPNWDGPFRIQHNLNNGAYKLEHLSGEPIPRTWNSSHLKMYYS
uniref:Gypsy retrotransposon integrase-like protein 1 n=1 Tax=Cajanus cajan TaxID=3821 RepID=A0A151SNS3_CAJCA|nr:Gypsy retrotransposon integrase-like protein 1 [Cajanus cajan]